MNGLLLNTESQAFISNNLDSDVTSLILKGATFEGVTSKELIEQIEAKKRSQTKLPTWFHQENIYYPNKINIEQTSSELTAEYKASLINGQRIIDLTGGFGVDCLYFSKRFKEVIHCEIDDELSQIVAHNFEQMKIGIIKTIATDGIDYLKNSKRHYDWIYLDPSRRHDSKGKVFFLADCLPNVPKELPTLFEHSNHMLIKTAPLLDISAGINELNHVKAIHVVAVNNDVKELLWVLEKNYQSEISIKTINLKSDTKEVFKFNLKDEASLTAHYSKPLTYLYEPNSAILKAGAFNSIADQLKLYKLHKHSHLYTSDQLINFPGRRFNIVTTLPYHKKQLKNLNIQKANITIRNFPETVQQLRNTFKIKDGGNVYLFFTTTMDNEKVILVCSKVA